MMPDEQISRCNTGRIRIYRLSRGPRPAFQGYECGVERKVSAGAHSQQTYNRLTDIYELIGEEEYDEAYSLLQNLEERTRRQDYDQAVINQAMGHVRMQQAKTMLPHVAHFQRAVELNAMPNAQHFEMILLIANIYYTMDRFSGCAGPA